MTRRNIVLVLLCGAAAPGCGNDGGSTYTSADKDAMSASVGDTGVFGSVAVSVEAGVAIPSLAAGNGDGKIVDGWEIKYSKLLVTIGEFKATQIDDNGVQSPLGDGSVQIVDLAAVSPDGTVIRMFDRVPVGIATDVGFSLLDATADAEPIGVSEEDANLMATNRYAIYVEGTISSPTGQTCTPGVPGECKPATTIKFAWGISAASTYADCSDFEVFDGEAADVGLKLPGDRWLQVDFSRRNPVRRAQWIADADLDRDGETTIAELTQVPAKVLFPVGTYDLTRAPVPVETARDFFVGQAHMIGRTALGTCRGYATAPQ